MGTREDLAQRLRSSRDELIAAVESMESWAFEEGRYENGWNARQILAHIAAVEWTYPRLIDLAREARPGEGEAGRAEAPARGGMDAYNARQVQRRQGAAVAELIDEFRRNRDAFIAAVEATDESLFEAPVRSAGGRTGTLGQVLEEVALGHVRQHLEDLRGARAKGE